MLARCGVAVVAVIVIAWLGLLYRDTRVGSEASQQLFRPTEATRADFDRSLGRLDSAGTLNPDGRWQLEKANYQLLRGRRADAFATADAIVRREPANYVAWIIVFRAGEKIAPRRSREAVTQIRRLNPRLARR